VIHNRQVGTYDFQHQETCHAHAYKPREYAFNVNHAALFRPPLFVGFQEADEFTSIPQNRVSTGRKLLFRGNCRRRPPPKFDLYPAPNPGWKCLPAPGVLEIGVSSAHPVKRTKGYGYNAGKSDTPATRRVKSFIRHLTCHSGFFADGTCVVDAISRVTRFTVTLTLKGVPLPLSLFGTSGASATKTIVEESLAAKHTLGKYSH
jgi:hypothetical protein